METTPRDFYQDIQGTQENCLENGNSSVSVHRRLAESGRFSGLGSAKNEVTSQASSSSWLVNEPGRVGACPQTGIPVSGVHVRPDQVSLFPTRAEVHVSVQGDSSVICLPCYHNQISYDSTGSHGMHGEACSTGLASHGTDSGRVKETVESKKSRSKYADQGDKLFSDVSLNLGTSSLMSCKTDSFVRKIHSMKSEHSSRHPVDKETYSSHKVES